MIRFYTYDDIAKIFRVSKQTVKDWKSKGRFQIYGYRPYFDKDRHRRREVVIDESEVIKLCEEIFKRGSWYMSNQDKRLMRYRDNKIVDDVVNDKVINEVEVANQSSLDTEDSDRDNSHIEGDEIIVNHDDNQDEKTNNE